MKWDCRAVWLWDGAKTHSFASADAISFFASLQPSMPSEAFVVLESGPVARLVKELSSDGETILCKHINDVPESLKRLSP